MYGNADNFLKVFNPDIQRVCAADLNRTFRGKAPTLNAVRETYGTETAETWAKIQVRDLSEYSGVNGKLTENQTKQIAMVICSMYGYMKVTEIAYFFLLCKSGRYGRFYGVVDGMQITEALNRFCRERGETLYRLSAEEDRRRKEAEDRASAERARAFHRQLELYGITVQEWLANRDLFDSGRAPGEIKAELERRKENAV